MDCFGWTNATQSFCEQQGYAYDTILFFCVMLGIAAMYVCILILSKKEHNMKTRAQLQQEYEAMPIEEHDPFACDCERCVREQRRRVNER